MSNSMAIDDHFMQMATPLLSEFGFSTVKELVREQLSLMLQAKISHYSAENSLYESRCGGSFDDVCTKAYSTGHEDFERDDILNDWRFAREAIELYRGKLKELQSA
jgi:hypothetical protein